VLTHGAGSNCNAPILVALSEELAARKVATLRCDLPYRQLRPHGPPRGSAAEDQAGLRRAVEVLRRHVDAPIFLGGVSYGGRQATMLVAASPDLVEGLLVLSYPLHPPGKPNQLRIAHFPKIIQPALFVSGTKDPFASPEELTSAIASIPVTTRLIVIDGAGHDLGARGTKSLQVVKQIAEEFERMFLQ
jgi:predicted alpha/beta-hydrolase family hydrolase